jgi:hypothetical protein
MVLATAAFTSQLSRATAAGGRLPLLGFATGARRPGAAPAAGRALSTMKAVADLRKEYSASGLEEAQLPNDPFPLFRQWLEEAVNAQVGAGDCTILWPNGPEIIIRLMVNERTGHHSMMAALADRTHPVVHPIPNNPFQVIEPNAMCLSTVGPGGRPSGRFVLLKVCVRVGVRNVPC